MTNTTTASSIHSDRCVFRAKEISGYAGLVEYQTENAHPWIRTLLSYKGVVHGFSWSRERDTGLCLICELEWSREPHMEGHLMQWLNESFTYSDNKSYHVVNNWDSISKCLTTHLCLRRTTIACCRASQLVHQHVYHDEYDDCFVQSLRPMRIQGKRDFGLCWTRLVSNSKYLSLDT
jgi:hypothetical protein